MLNKVRLFCESITARVLIYGMCCAQVSHVEICRRTRILKFKKQQSKYSVLNIDSVTIVLIEIRALQIRVCYDCILSEETNKYIHYRGKCNFCSCPFCSFFQTLFIESGKCMF